MPSLEDIEQFKEVLNTLGNEPEILEERGEVIEDVPVPQQGLPDELSELFGDISEVTDDIGDVGEVADDIGEVQAAVPDVGEEEPFGEIDQFLQEGAEEDFLEDLPDTLSLEEAIPEETGEEESAPEPIGDEFALPEQAEPDIGEEDLAPEAFASDAIGDEFAIPESDLPEDIFSDEALSDEAFEDEFALPEEAEPTADEESAAPETIASDAIDDEFAIPESDLSEDAFEDEFALPDEPAPGDVGEESLPETIDDEFAIPETDLSEDVFSDEALSEETFDDEFALPEGLIEGEPVGEEESVQAPSEQVPSEEIPSEEVPMEEAFGDDFALPDDQFEFPVEPESEGEAEEYSIEEQIAAPGEESMEFDAEEGFDLPAEPGEEEPEVDESGFELPEDLKFTDDEELDSLSEDMLETEGFTLGDISKEFGEIGEEAAAPVMGAELPEIAAIGDEEISLTEDEFRAIQRTLGTLPRNLKLAIEELIGEQGLAGKELQRLLTLLLKGASPRDLAAVTGKILGKTIKIPVQYEKRTGLEFEEEKGTFAYAFRHNILPILRVTALAIVVLGVLSFVGYRYIYRPIHAQNLYQKGYEEIGNQQYVDANDYFLQGLREWPRKEWFYRYADAFIDEREYARAEEKYEQLLNMYELDRRGIFDYARLESEIITNYPKAEELYNLILDDDIYDQEALIALGDNYMRWGEEDFAKFEEARFTYATLIQRYGHLDILEFKMLNYFMRMDMLDEVIRLKNQFQANSQTEIDPVIYARMGGYLVSRNHLDDVQDILFKVLEIDETIPEAHYYLSQYFRKIEEYSEEEKGINNALVHFDNLPRLTKEELAVKIRALGRKGEIFLGREEYLSGEETLLNAIDLYEDGIDRGILAVSTDFGKLYEHVGDIYYYQNNDYSTAIRYYQQAENNEYWSPNLSYKKGFVHFNQENYQDALMTFYAASEGFSTNRNLLYATANTLYKRNDFFLAEGYYYDLLASLEQERQNIAFLRPDERADHRGLVEFLFKTYNNLGVTLYRLSERSDKKDEKYANGLVNLTKSAELADAYTRDPEGMERSESANLAWLNTRGMLYPASEFIPQLYTNIPKDMNDLLF